MPWWPVKCAASRSCSAAAASEIKGLINTSVAAVDGGVRHVEDAGAAIKEIVDGVQGQPGLGNQRLLA